MKVGSLLVNDLYRLNKTEVLKKVKDSTRFSSSFVMLLVGSSIVCTLGLLLNSTEVVIGGMIISPLMWPLMQTSLGISYAKVNYIKQAILILIVATIIGIISAYFITLVSPLKELTNEILARTNPTLMDIIIALAAGGIAALAISEPKVSESLAGVAIATSLMPPLCVSGIGLALANMQVFQGGLLLYLTNVVSIIFISILFFIKVGIHGTGERDIQKKGLSITAIILVILAIPLFYFLKDSVFKANVYSRVESTLNSEMASLFPNIVLSNITVNSDRSSPETLQVGASVLVPEGIYLNYEDRQLLIDSLEKTLNRDVNLTLQVQNCLSILSKEDIEKRSTQELISSLFVSNIKEMQPDATVDSVQVTYNDSLSSWEVNSVLRGDPSTTFTYEDQQILKEILQSSTNAVVDLNVEIISRVKIQTKPDELNSQIKQEVNNLLLSISKDIYIDSINISAVKEDLENPAESVNTEDTANGTTLSVPQELYLVEVQLIIPSTIIIGSTTTLELERDLELKFNKKFDVKINYTSLVSLD